MVSILEDCNIKEKISIFLAYNLEHSIKINSKESRHLSTSLGIPAVFQDWGREWWCLKSGPGDAVAALRAAEGHGGRSGNTPNILTVNSSTHHHMSHIGPSSNYTVEDSTHEHHQMVNTKIRLIIFFAAKDGDALYSQQKQDQELTVAQIMNSLLPDSDLNGRK